MEEKDYILHKALAIRAKTDLEQCLQKLEKVCELYAEKIGMIDKNLLNSAKLCDVAKFSKKLDNIKSGFLSLLAIKNRVNLLLSRNNERIELLSKILSDSGIYDENFDKKEFNEILNSSDEITEASIGLNCYADGEVVYKYIDGNVFGFKGNLLDMSLDFNKEKLLTLESSAIRKLFNIFPNFVSTIPTDLWLNVGLKHRVLKELTGYVSEQIRNKSISQINKDLGSLLSFKTEITSDTESYIAGVQNMIDAMSKNEVAMQYPEKIAEINSKLKCNEKSELIPKSKRVAVLANGLAGNEVEDENKQSEELRIKQEKEMQDLQNLQMLSDFLDFDLSGMQLEEIQESENENRDAEKIKLENKKLEEQKQEDAEEKELEEFNSLIQSYIKHDD